MSQGSKIDVSCGWERDWIFKEGPDERDGEVALIAGNSIGIAAF